ncbi:hypothetical protein EK21DRAFT_88198 [Setomelanomma holmii]|uniref:Uncharacterized protein n=1 Tax=Setomelanomma holmii TaxID=210430 RepID=A0A9P4HB36_9PLEO|nr:hypothetical protein EK21DRAFT_88198 [Setomelanomma holmii]
MSQSTLPAFGPRCPSGGSWYACGTGTYFVGCCARNPCSITCPAGDLYPAGFDPAFHGQFPDPSCGTGVKPWTCIAGNTFLGCCKSDACSTTSGCPSSDLEPAYLNAENLRIAYGAVAASSSSSAIPSSTLSTAAASQSTVTPTATGSAAAATVSPIKSGPPVAAIAGGAAGGASVLAILIGLLIYYFCHAKKSRNGHEDTVDRRESDLPAMTSIQVKHNGHDTPPPGYRSPNPNEYYAAHSPYHSFAHHQQWSPASEPQSPVNLSRKPVGGHQRNLSELSGDTAIRSELESPLGTPRMKSHLNSPLSSPPLGADVEWQSPVIARTRTSGRNWVPHESWQTQAGPEIPSSSAHGLGLHTAGGAEAYTPDRESGANTRRYGRS